jgi:hypothetical protein
MKLGPFGGDYEALANLVEQSWAENKESSLRYTPEFLRSCFEYPGTTVDLAPTIYQEGRPVAFIAGFPRNVEWNGKPEKLILSTLLTSSPATKGKGYGAWLWGDLARRSRGAGYEGMISLCVAGGQVNRIVEECGRRMGYPTARIFTIGYRSAIITQTAAQTQPCSDNDIDLFLELAAASTQRLPFRRVWTRPEAEWQCRDRTGAIVAASHTPGARGIITGYVIDTLASPPVRVLIIEDLLWDEMQSEARKRLLNEFLAQGASKGAKAASVAITGQTDYEVLKTSGFRSILRRMNVYVTRWEGPPPEPADALYLDVL